MIRRSGLAAMMTMTALCAGAVVADDNPGRPRTRAGAGNGQGSAQAFKRLDANGDGRVSKPEFEAMTQKLAERGQGKAGAMGGRIFDRLDANGDGSISSSEFEKVRGQRPGAGAAGGAGRKMPGRAGAGRGLPK